MATPPTPTSGALTVNSTTGVILSPVTATLFKSANGIGSGTGDVTASGTLTANALILGGGTTVVSASALTYSGTTLSVPDAFVVSSAGSIGLTAGGGNKNITALPSGTGYLAIGQGDANGISSDFDVLVSEKDTSSHSYGLISYANSAFLRVWRANGTYASPTALTGDAQIGGIAIAGRHDSGWSSAAALFSFNAYGNWTSGSTGTYFLLQTTNFGTTTRATKLTVFDSGKLQLSAVAGSTSSWGVAGASLELPAHTLTDTTSSGTVATAVNSSFAVPTFAASSATTFTNAANLYIAGDVANGTNVTLGNSYGLWNVGKTRLDGALSFGGTGGSTLSGSTAFTLTGGAGNMTLTAGTGASRTMTLQTTTSGSVATTALTLSATQAATFTGTITTTAGAVTSSNAAADSNANFTMTNDARSWLFGVDGSASDQWRLRDSTGGVNVITVQTGIAATALAIAGTGNVTFSNALITTPQALSGAGAVNLTTTSTFVTSTGAADALTLANGTSGQIKTIVHVVDGGNAILTPTTALGYTTITFAVAGDSVTLQYTAQGWAVVGSRGVVIA